MIELYDHQAAALDDLRQGFKLGHKRQVLAAATGFGKTVVAAHLACSAAKKGNKALFIVDKIELIGQAVRTLRGLGLRVGILQGDNTDFAESDDIIVASIQTIRARQAPWWVRVVIIDECHILHEEHVRLIERWNALPFIGLSATPLRKGLGRYFTNLVRGPSVRWLTDNGFLVPARGFAPAEEAVADAIKDVKVRAGDGDYVESSLARAVNQRELIGDIVSTWQARGEARQTLCFATSIAHSKAIRDDFEAVGVAVGHLDAYTPADERKTLVDAFRAREIRILSSVDVLGIGFDVPDASCLILARPTLSETKHFQQLGRGIRRAEGKADCLILDHSGNTRRFGLPIHFEVPDLDQSEQAKGEVKRKRDRDVLVTCTHCGALMERDERTCPRCGLDRPQRSSKVTYRDEELVEFGAAESPPGSSIGERRAFYQKCVALMLQRGSKPERAYHLTKAKFGGFRAPWSWRELEPLEPTPDVVRFVRSQDIRYRKGRGR